MSTILLDLVVPVTRIQLGSLVFDPLEQALGRPLSEVLRPVCVGSPTQRETPSGPQDVYRLVVPPGESVSVGLGPVGELGLGNTDGQLVITTPSAGALVLRPQLQHKLVREDRDARVWGDVVRMTCAVRRGDRVAIPLGRFGELGVEVA